VRRRGTPLDHLPSLMIEMLKDTMVALGARPD
jgi:hypothetical protein